MHVIEQALTFIKQMLSVIQQESDVDTAVRFAEWLAFYIHENACGVYRYDDLEQSIVDKFVDEAVPVSVGEPADDELHVASVIYRSGGHTPLLRYLIKHSAKPVKVLLTRMTDRVAGCSILELDAAQVDVIDASWSAKARMAFLIRTMLCHKRVFLHIHPDDVLCAAAVRVVKRIRPSLMVYFVNHADHVFSVGLGVADKVFEISTYGWMLRERRGTVDKSSFIGIPIVASVVEAVVTKPQGERKLLLTGGASYKFRPLLGMSLPVVLCRLLEADPRLDLVVLGASGKDWWWWRMRLKFGRRVTLLKSVPKDVYRQYVSDAALYIDSYPWLGGTAFPEALLLGKAVAGLCGVAWGYSVADELRSDDVPGFIKRCSAIINGDAAELAQQQRVRQNCQLFHDPIEVRSRVDVLLEHGTVVCPTADQLRHAPAPLVESLWQQRGRSVLPPRRKVPLSVIDLRLIWRHHVKSYGYVCLSSMKLFFYAYLKRSVK
ncbi:MAG: hypothetical protein Q7U28_11045 [Aquabacterium sp.]|nr:hypothetical protein [Aquabacterium sp.]